MAVYRDREHYIPHRRSDIIELLAAQLDPGRAALFRRLCQLLTDRVHLEFYRLFDRLKDDYAPFDPDADTKPLTSPDPAARFARADRLFLAFDRLLLRANFRRLTEDEVIKCQTGSSPWGLNMSIDMPSAGIILQTMPLAVISQVILHAMAGIIMPPIMGIGIMPFIIGFIPIGIIMGIMPFIIGI